MLTLEIVKRSLYMKRFEWFGLLSFTPSLSCLWVNVALLGAGTPLWKLDDANMLYRTCDSCAMLEISPPNLLSKTSPSVMVMHVSGTFSVSDTVFGFSAALELH